MMANDEKFHVSGWEDDLNDIDEERNPHETPEKEVLWAAENGNITKLQSLINENHSLIQITDKDGYTPLHRACYSNHINLVKYLIENGANLLAKTQMQWEPLHSCCQWNNKECALQLIQNGADVNAQSEGKQTPLHIAASHGTSYDTVQLLLMHPYINPSITNNSNETAKDIAQRSSKYYNIFDMTDPALNGIEDV